MIMLTLEIGQVGVRITDTQRIARSPDCRQFSMRYQNLRYVSSTQVIEIGQCIKECFAGSLTPFDIVDSALYGLSSAEIRKSLDSGVDPGLIGR
jgi:hypothetical protein